MNTNSKVKAALARFCDINFATISPEKFDAFVKHVERLKHAHIPEADIAEAWNDFDAGWESRGVGGSRPIAFAIHKPPFEVGAGKDNGYSVRDANDNAVSHSYLPENAELIVAALNAYYRVKS